MKKVNSISTKLYSLFCHIFDSITQLHSHFDAEEILTRILTLIRLFSTQSFARNDKRNRQVFINNPKLNVTLIPMGREKSKHSLLVIAVLLLSLTSVPTLSAQNLEQIGQGSPFSVSGGINVNQVFYTANGVESRRDPYNYFMSGNVNFSIYGWSVPLSFSYSNQNASFHQPFNQYGISPTYKWVTAHMGYRSMNFSKYTLAGHLFLGGGLDLQPSEKVKVSVMYGRLQKAVEEDTTNTNNLPAYRRMGGGAKVTLGSNTNSIDLIFFKAEDDVNSLRNAPTSEAVNPEENLVLGLGFKTTPFKGFSIKGEIANSAMTSDVRSEEVTGENFYKRMDWAIKPRTSSSYYTALNGTAQYQFSKYSFGVAYERIDPGYRTLGAYYFNNDIESISAIHSSSWLDQKVRVSARFGVQRNNLDNDELNSMNRLSGALSLNYQVSPRLMTMINYSNFSTIINFRTPVETFDQVTPYDNLDTLNYKQVSQNATFGTNYLLSENEERRQNINFNFSYQQTADEQGGETQNTGSKYYNFNTAYSMNIANLGLTLSASGNMNLSISPQVTNTIFGPSFSGKKSFLENKLSANATVSYNNAMVNGDLSTRVVNFRLGGNYTIKEVHSLSLNVTSIDRFSPQNETAQKFRELVAELGYNYNFSSSK